jgi:hypothetical protein
MEGSSMRIRDAGGDILSAQRDTLLERVRQPGERTTRWEGPPGRHGKSTRYDSNAVCRALRASRAGKGARDRLAELPEWDGLMRYDLNLAEGEVWVGGSEDVTLEAQIALYDMARGNMLGAMGKRMQHDPNDPPCVRLDILKQSHPEAYVLSGAKPWGYR